MGKPLAPAAVAALTDEKARIYAYLSMCPPELVKHPSVVTAINRYKEIESALAASAAREGKQGKKLKKLLPQLIAQVQGVNPIIAAQMNDVVAGKTESIPALISVIASSVNPQLAALAPMVSAMLTDDDDDKE